MGNTSQMTGTRVKSLLDRKGPYPLVNAVNPPQRASLSWRGVAAYCNVTPNVRKTFVYVEDKQVRCLTPRGRPVPCRLLPPNDPWAGHREGGGWDGWAGLTLGGDHRASSHRWELQDRDGGGAEPRGHQL